MRASGILLSFPPGAGRGSECLLRYQPDRITTIRMLPVLLLTALLASSMADQGVQAPAATYGPPAPPPVAPAHAQAYAAPADVTALAEADGTAYVPYPYGYSDPGFSVQTGYEGYLVPYQGHSVSAPSALASLGLLGSLLPLPKLGIKLFPKVGLFLVGFLFLLLIGGAFTTAVCAFTPICTISFLGLGLTRNSMRAYLTPDRLTQTTAFVLDAIDKYKDFSKKVSNKEARSKDGKRRRR